MMNTWQKLSEQVITVQMFSEHTWLPATLDKKEQWDLSFVVFLAILINERY